MAVRGRPLRAAPWIVGGSSGAVQGALCIFEHGCLCLEFRISPNMNHATKRNYLHGTECSHIHSRCCRGCISKGTSTAGVKGSVSVVNHHTAGQCNISATCSRYLTNVHSTSTLSKLCYVIEKIAAARKVSNKQMDSTSPLHSHSITYANCCKL